MVKSSKVSQPPLLAVLSITLRAVERVSFKICLVILVCLTASSKQTIFGDARTTGERKEVEGEQKVKNERMFKILCFNYDSYKSYNHIL